MKELIPGIPDYGLYVIIEWVVLLIVSVLVVVLIIRPLAARAMEGSLHEISDGRQVFYWG